MLWKFILLHDFVFFGGCTNAGKLQQSTELDKVKVSGFLQDKFVTKCIGTVNSSLIWSQPTLSS